MNSHQSMLKPAYAAELPGQELFAFSRREAMTIPLNTSALSEQLALTTDLTPTIEAFANWLGRFIQLEMVAYWNPRLQKSYMVMMDKKGDKSNLLQTTMNIIDSPLPRMRHWRQQEWFFHFWSGMPLDRWDRLLIVERGSQLSLDEANYLVWEALQIFQQPLHRALRKEMC